MLPTMPKPLYLAGWKVKENFFFLWEEINRRMKMSPLILVILGLSALTIPATLSPLPSHAQQDEGEYNIRFLWAFGVLVKEGEGQKLVPITRDTQLKSGDRIKFFVKVENNSFVYVVYHSSQGEVSVLFPYRFEKSSGGYQAPVHDYIQKAMNGLNLMSTQDAKLSIDSLSTAPARF